VTDKDGQLNYAKAVTVENKMITPREKNTFFHEMDPTIDLKNTKLPKTYPESMKISTGVVNFDEAKFRALPKMYIITDNDPVFTVDTQRMFLKGAGIHKTSVIPTGHFPMISKPKVLADTIISFLKVPVIVAKGA
jgi:pimeloyl-ACP methyl ester carboxylesterase